MWPRSAPAGARSPSISPRRPAPGSRRSTFRRSRSASPASGPSWRARFAANRERVAALADERFCRMWEYYLAAVEVGFLNGSNMVFQLLLSTTNDAVPIVRDPIPEQVRADAALLEVR